MVVAAVAATAFFALMPALQATRIDPVRTLRGETVKDVQPNRARSVLIGVQVFASALLLICAAIFLRSAIASARIQSGVSHGRHGLDRHHQRAEACRHSPGARRRPVDYRTPRPSGPRCWPRRPEHLPIPGTGKTPITYKFVSAGYFDLLGIPIVRGRSFTAAERDDYPTAIVSESVARALWPNGNGIGETFWLEPDLDTSAPVPASGKVRHAAER